MFKPLRVLIALSFLSSNVAHAIFTSPLGIALIPPIQFPHETFAVAGARASVLWGRHSNVYGFDFGGLGNITENIFAGIQVSGVFNINMGAATLVALQAAAIANHNEKAFVVGLQIAGFNINKAESVLVGLGVGLVNYSPFMTVNGAQIGIFNQARFVNGFQIGVINYTELLRGIQIGLLNFNPTGLFAVSPFLNVGF